MLALFLAHRLCGMFAPLPYAAFCTEEALYSLHIHAPQKGTFRQEKHSQNMAHQLHYQTILRSHTYTPTCSRAATA